MGLPPLFEFTDVSVQTDEELILDQVTLVVPPTGITTAPPPFEIVAPSSTMRLPTSVKVLPFMSREAFVWRVRLVNVVALPPGQGDLPEAGLPKRVGEVWVRRESDEAAIFDPATGALHRLNPSALAIWELCDGKTTIDEMAEAVAELASLPIRSALEDVGDTVAQLEVLSLVELVTGPQQ